MHHTEVIRVALVGACTLVVLKYVRVGIPLASLRIVCVCIHHAEYHIDSQCCAGKVDKIRKSYKIQVYPKMVEVYFQWKMPTRKCASCAQTTN